MGNIKLLDCTLRDGGYINDWRWGYTCARDIVHTVARAGVDIVEVGFLRDIDRYDPDVTLANTIGELNRLLPADAPDGVEFSGMAMRSNYTLGKLAPYNGRGIGIIRITAHDYDLAEGLDFARAVQALGYRVSINPINIMGYADDELRALFTRVNDIRPWQFSVVDTFGSMRRQDLRRIVGLADGLLDPGIRLGLHLHENLSLSFCLAQDFLELGLERDVTVDASLMGMGRVPGNLPIELIADHLNAEYGAHYDIDELMDAIQDHIAPLKGESSWGYTPAYFLSARFNLHRNYAEYYLGKGDLTNRDINHILSGIPHAKATVFDGAYAERLYEEYRRRNIDDSAALAALRAAFAGKTVLVLAPGASLGTAAGQAAVAAARREAAVTVSANFIPDLCAPDYAFFANGKRLDRLDGAADCRCPLVLTSNLRTPRAGALTVNYDRLAGDDHRSGNSVLMLLRLLRLCGAGAVLLAGADGYRTGAPAYLDASLHTHTDRGEAYNARMAGCIAACGVPVRFITPSAYDRRR